jgi:predicted helicase
MATMFDAYLLALRQTQLGDKTEHTDRAALQSLLQAIAGEKPGNINVQHEPKRVPDKGAPDFKITSKGMILGYVENKAIGENLDKVLKSDQIKKYLTLSQNILLTDYLNFIWISKNGVQRETLCYATDLENPKFKPREDRVDDVTQLLQAFFSTAPEGIGRAKPLAQALAVRSRLLRDHLGEELERQEREHKEGRLFGLFQIFRDQIFHALTLAEFADAFVQMLAYGLFLARLNSDSQPITLHNARQYVPGSFRLIRELVDFLNELEKDEYRDVRWVVEEVLSIVNGLNLLAIHEDLSFRQRKAVNRKLRAADEEEHRLFERDPFIYFYEDYLKAYDKEMRKGRGVYYTPPPIVNFIVRAVDDILKDSFGIKDGLADHQRVTVLDFACGTGTFLLEVFQRIFETIGGPDSGRADLIVRQHFLKNIFGFEYLIAPYTIAHLKLSQYLRDQGHPLKDDERLQVFLTNTLEPIHPEPNFLLPAITAETEAAQTIKDRPILVITGNPPYSGHSKNKGKWISAAIDGYKFTIETDEAGKEFNKPLGERNPKWLNDDYVKFIRFAQMKMDAVPEGIVGIITNHSWLDNPTFRGMRQSLMRSFEQIYVLDLHGNAKKKERAPDGSKDENVFDIEQGVAISLFVKRPGLERGVWRGDLWGKRLEKYKAAAEGTLKSLDLLALQPVTPFYLFARQDAEIRSEYQAGWRLTEIFPVNVLGFQTHRDDFAISFTEEEMKRKLRELADPKFSDDELARRYGLKSNRDWSFPDSRSAARKGEATSLQIVAYRPFDDRWSEFSSLTMDYPRRELLDHVARRANITLLAPRGIGTKDWQHAFIADVPANDCVISNRSREANQVFPLWRFGNGDTEQENLSPEFRTFIDARYDHHYTPEEILGYIYAVLHAPAYRTRYAEFLRIDFPRVPFPEAKAAFDALSGLGWAMVQAHLLHELPRHNLAAYHGRGDHRVEAVRYSPEEAAIWINKTQCFKPVPQAVWEFHIGGYQVLDKYLKSRKGRTLSLDEINHVSAIADCLTFTIEQMAAIDTAYRAAFAEL